MYITCFLVHVCVYQVTSHNRHGAKNVVSKKAKYLDIFPAGDTYTIVHMCGSVTCVNGAVPSTVRLLVESVH